MAAGRGASRPTYCPFCANGSHRLCCRTDCACAERGHTPDVETAAAMRLYQVPTLARAGFTVEQLATQYRQRTGAAR